MSCFSGTLREYPSVLVDCFTADAEAYFLSHCHRDHMDGLDSPWLAARLQSSQHLFIYCSETSKNLLICNESYAHLENYLRGIPVDQPQLVVLDNKFTDQQENLLVTLIPAGHCVGSVMFLFEGKQGNVLYTGDFRLAKRDAKRITHLHSNERVKDIKSVYVDTTFCLPKMMSIPSREETRDAIIGLIDRWFSRGSDRVVSLLCKGMYGYEYLLKEVAAHYKTKIHVSDERLAMYRYLVAMTPHFTTNPKETRIHACVWKEDKNCPTDLPCMEPVGSSQKLRVLRIKPSTLWFARHEEPLPRSCTRYSASERLWRVVHSMHASMEEIRDLIGYIRPYHVFPCVKPAGLRSLDEAADSLKDLTRVEECDSCNREDSGDTMFREAAADFEKMTEDIAGRAKRLAPGAEVTALCKELGLDWEPMRNAPPIKRKRNKKRTCPESAADPAQSSPLPHTEENRPSTPSDYCDVEVVTSSHKEPWTSGQEVAEEPRERGGPSAAEGREVCDTDYCPRSCPVSDLVGGGSNFGSVNSDQTCHSASDTGLVLRGTGHKLCDVTDHRKVGESSAKATEDGANCSSGGPSSESTSCKSDKQEKSPERLKSVGGTVHKNGENLRLLEVAFTGGKSADFADAERWANSQKDVLPGDILLGGGQKSSTTCSYRSDGGGNDFDVPPSPGHAQPSPGTLRVLQQRLKSGSRICNKSLLDSEGS